MRHVSFFDVDEFELDGQASDETLKRQTSGFSMMPSSRPSRESQALTTRERIKSRVDWERVVCSYDVRVSGLSTFP